MGEHIQIIDGPWKQRIGCTGVTVPATSNVYPWSGLGRGEVVVLLDNDPLTDGKDRERGWSCVIDRQSLRVLA